MRDVIYEVATVSTKCYRKAQFISEKLNKPFIVKVVEHKEKNPRAGRYANNVSYPYKAPYAK